MGTTNYFFTLHFTDNSFNFYLFGSHISKPFRKDIFRSKANATNAIL